MSLDVIVVPVDFSYKTINELMDAFKKDPGAINGGACGGVDHIIAWA